MSNGIVARFGFHVLILSLIYSAVRADILSEYWFVAAAFFVLALATRQQVYCIYGVQAHITNPRGLYAPASANLSWSLSVLPILIFPIAL
jgi:hypothetical protein